MAALGSSGTTVLADGATPFGVAVDDNAVYWTGPDAGVVMKAKLSGGVPETLATAQDEPWTIAVDASSVYWTNRGSGSTKGAVMKFTPK